MSELSSRIYDPFEAMEFGQDRCFLCGCHLERDNRTDEHVFPKWLQHRYGLWDETITLLNRTHIPYRQLTIPSCTTCNNGPLSSLEKEISAAVECGFERFRALEPLRVFQWISKLFYGLLYKEAFLKLDRASRSPEKITSPDLLESLRMCHVFLQSVRLPVKFEGFVPWSMHLFQLKPPSDPRHLFDYRDALNSLTFGVQLGDIGVIMCLQDNGTHARVFCDYFAKFENLKLHRLQFQEVMAKVFYKNGLLNRTPKYVTFIGDEHQETLVLTTPLQGFSSHPLYDDWDPRIYAQILSQFWGFPMEDVFREPDQVLSLLTDENDVFTEID